MDLEHEEDREVFQLIEKLKKAIEKKDIEKARLYAYKIINSLE